MNELNEYPKMLVMRNQTGGMLWQAYRVNNEQEERIITKNAKSNYFLVETEAADYTNETIPNWRETKEWQDCLDIDNKIN